MRVDENTASCCHFHPSPFYFRSTVVIAVVVVFSIVGKHKNVGSSSASESRRWVAKGRRSPEGCSSAPGRHVRRKEAKNSPVRPTRVAAAAADYDIAVVALAAASSGL